jgi:DNA (cytosine-5)-methyltransferase 1
VAVDLFCGAGGLTRGLLDAGIRVVAGYDIAEECRYPYEHNNRPAVFKKESVSDITGEQLSALYPQGCWRVLVGCAPCQPFSKYTQGSDAASDEKWGLLHHFARLAEEMKPDVISMENVPELQRHSIFEEFVSRLKALRYQVTSSVVFCPDYGIPQQRSRLVLFASRLGPIDLVPPTHTRDQYPTVRMTIGRLSELGAGEASPEDALHRSSKLSSVNLQRMRASQPGGTWRDWDLELRAACHRKRKGKTYPSVYGRMEWDSPSPTITTQFFGFGNGRFGHPEQDRAISLREGAVLQTFPLDYQFVKTGGQYYLKTIGRLIGNAVPVRLGEIIGRSITLHLSQAQQ